MKMKSKNCIVPREFLEDLRDYVREDFNNHYWMTDTTEANNRYLKRVEKDIEKVETILDEGGFEV